VKADSKSKVYGQDDPALTYGIARGNLVGNDTLSGGLQRAAGENVGDYAIRQGNLSASNNYNLGFVEGTLTITARPITITADAKSKLFGDADPALTYQVTRGSLVQGDSFSGNLTRDTGESVGAYPIRQGNVSAGNNYELTYNGANLTIGTWSLKGFHAPVDMLDGTGNIMVNTVKGGSTVPMKFEVFKGATELKDVSAIKSTTYLKSTACNGAYADEIEVVLTGNTSLRFDATSDQFVYNWKTPTGAGCYKSIVTTQDGSQLIAYFKTR
jgi:hypothetical protein